MDTNKRFDMYENQLDGYFAELRASRLDEFIQDSERIQRIMLELIRNAYYAGAEDERNDDIRYVGKKEREK